MSDAELLWKIIAILAICGNLFVIGRKLFGQSEAFRLSNSPLLVAEHQEFMSRRECTIHHKAFDSRLGSLERSVEIMRGEWKTDIGDLHEKMNLQHAEVIRALGRLEGT